MLVGRIMNEEWKKTTPIIKTDEGLERKMKLDNSGSSLLNPLRLLLMHLLILLYI